MTLNLGRQSGFINSVESGIRIGDNVALGFSDGRITDHLSAFTDHL
jgi:hypothetical protein